MYILPWADTNDIPMFQGIITAILLSGRIVSILIFSLSMTSARAQLIFFICIAVISMISASLLNCLLYLVIL